MHKIDIEGKEAVINAAPFLEAFELKARALACFDVKSIENAKEPKVTVGGLGHLLGILRAYWTNM